VIIRQPSVRHTENPRGTRLPTALQACDIGEICESALGRMKAGHPDRAFSLQKSGDLGGSFDRARLRQLFEHLLDDAVQHGEKGSPVILEAHGGPAGVSVRVRSSGFSIPADAWRMIFEPLARSQRAACRMDSHGSAADRGFGFLAALSMVLAHGGTLVVEASKRSETILTARFPRSA
jgi:signal transduction histidine kinase